jgi:hypothetical protein
MAAFAPAAASVADHAPAMRVPHLLLASAAHAV